MAKLASSNSTCTICCLFYGNYPYLAERLLKSLARWAGDDSVRFFFGLNNACKKTQDLVHDFMLLSKGSMNFIGAEPYHKYPMMRRMLGCVDTEYMMWFDDDSWVLPTAPVTWPQDVLAFMRQYSLDMAGAPYKMRLRGNQHLYLNAQPWANKVTWTQGQEVRFITGGWWTIKTAILQRHNWPVPELDHNGGDILLGALFAAQMYRIGRYTEHLAINANDTGKCSSAIRRGHSGTSCGADYWPDTKPVPAKTNWLDIIDGKE